MAGRWLRSWTDSDRINRLSAEAEVVYIRLIMVADDYGRYAAHPRLLRSGLFPYRDGIDEGHLGDLVREIASAHRGEEEPLIYLYEVAGKKYLEITNFGQRLRTESKAKFPPRPGAPEASAAGPPRVRRGSAAGPPRNVREFPSSRNIAPPEAIAIAIAGREDLSIDTIEESEGEP